LTRVFAFASVRPVNSDATGTDTIGRWSIPSRKGEVGVRERRPELFVDGHRR